MSSKPKPNRFSDLKHFCIFLLLLICTSVGALEPPQQDLYLHFSQNTDFCCGPDGLMNGRHEVAIVRDGVGQERVIGSGEELTVEAWVRWEPSDLTEVAQATGIDIDRMTLFCGSRAWGFQRGSNGADEWTFFLQTENFVHHDTGPIPLPSNEWAHLAATYNRELVRTYLNGQLQTETVANGLIPAPGDAFGELCHYGTGEYGQWWGDMFEWFAIGVGTGFTGGIRQLRIWNRALSQAELTQQATIHLDGDEEGLLAYWPMDEKVIRSGPSIENPNATDGVAVNKQIPNGADFPLSLFYRDNSSIPSWRQTIPMFEVREDLADDVVVTGCASLSASSSNWIDVEYDGDLDLIFSGETGPCFSGLTPFRALVREGEKLRFDTGAAISGTPPMAALPLRSAVEDFNADGHPDIFSGNAGEDWCTGYGATNTLMLSRPDGRLQDASDQLVGPPCDAEDPQFEGQQPCYHGSDFLNGETHFEKRYPGTGPSVPLEPDFTHSVASGDIDNDGDIDLFVGNQSPENPYFLINDGSGGFIPNREWLPALWEPENSRWPADSLLQDLDQDGFVDLIFSPYPEEFHLPGRFQQPGIYWGDGSGDFSKATATTLWPFPQELWDEDNLPPQVLFVGTSDIDADGDPDLIFGAGHQPNLIHAEVSIMINQGNRQFEDQTIERLGAPVNGGLDKGWANWTDEIHLVDVNGDKCPDLFYGENLTAELWGSGIWLNDCRGYFARVDQVVRPKDISEAIPFDYDNDGDMDMLSWRSSLINLSDNSACAPGEGQTADYIDFAVWLNVTPRKYGPLIFRSGFEP